MTLTLSDLYHKEAPDLINYYQSADNTNNNGGAEPVPDAALINEAQNVKFTMVPGKTYLFRVINMGAMAAQYLQFDQHTMTIVEVDGQYVQPYDVQQLFVAVAQRYSVIVKAKADASKNYAIVASMNTAMFSESNQPAKPNVSPFMLESLSSISNADQFSQGIGMACIRCIKANTSSICSESTTILRHSTGSSRPEGLVRSSRSDVRISNLITVA